MPLDAVGVEPIGDHGGGVHGHVVPVEKPPLGQQLRPFQPQTPPELAQGALMVTFLEAMWE